ncbi:S8 family serine peptidase [Streptomyces somaliensis DSM 40738]|uniref:S8 family serine peptidase n=1 Tax=Streptomyces somaliensis (strain ATCC 33201 / DSM 40738 / JCM 12659 / KCTC 9044 / NCTC 11332 / NRRL B-12077 / IP 733) TaxID=1134445 RepID=A0AA44DE69_STRE0|nr:S8 family serine peptidase [Streptomyces somaliensis]MCQ0024372.1 S8 family serine peptidase [Streptomyces somaliensis DSM 40738]NKY14760.1 S8 family serine peptidase [Streptomyces somaliensis DSM 40738]
MPAERIVVGYKAKTQEAGSNRAAATDATGKAQAAGEKLTFERRTGTGGAVFHLGGKRPKAEVTDLIAEFKADPDVAYVEAETFAHAMSTPNDTDYAKQWDLFEPTGGMNVPAAWGRTTGSGVTVAVLDTGYVAHSDLAANTVPGYDFISDATRARDGGGRDANAADEGDWNAAGECGTDSKASTSSWHGTHVAGTIGAVANNAKGVAGIAYGAKVQPVRVLGKCGGSSIDIADAIIWASGGSVPGVPANPTPAKVINMSLGGASLCSSVYQNAIDGAVARGTSVVVAAGNSSKNAALFTPAGCGKVITVAATNRTGDRSFYSNWGEVIDISAPGGETRRATDTPGTVTTPENGILSTVNAGTSVPTTESYKPFQGTSMAAPHVAGLVALMAAAKPGITPAQVETALWDNARPLPGSCPEGCGPGIADAARTVAAVAGGTDTGTNVYSNTTKYALPDNSRTGVTSSISVTGRTGTAPAALKVGVDITHTYRGDVAVELIAPDGTVRQLKGTGNDSTDDIKTTYTVDASSEEANGTWKLRVSDRMAGDTGTLNGWSLTF